MTKTKLPFEVRDSPLAGKGAFTIRPIRKGERIIEYVGERIPHPVADARYDDESMEEHHTFLFTVSSRTVIDASRGGNESRFINHSCEPNCETEIDKGRVYVFALRDIKVGEELAYDYGYERSGDETAKDERKYRCLCGTKSCRGTIMEPVAEYEKRVRAAKRKKAKARRERELQKERYGSGRKAAKKGRALAGKSAKR